MKHLSSRLRSARQAAQLAQASLACELQVSRSAVAQWEREGGSRPSTANLGKLASVLGCSFEWLATGHGTRTPGANVQAGDGKFPSTQFAQDDSEEQLLLEFRKLQRADQDLLLLLVDTLGRRAPASRR